MFVPKLFVTLKNYTREQFYKDDFHFDTTLQLDLNFLAKGIYMVEALIGDERVFNKVVKAGNWKIIGLYHDLIYIIHFAFYILHLKCEWNEKAN